MGFMDNINEQIYILFSMYYYEVFLYVGNVQVKRIIQAESFNPVFIVDFKGKTAYTIVKNCAFIKGHKLILHYDKNRGIPLTENTETEIKEISDVIIKTKKITTLTADINKPDKEGATPKYISETNLPPHLLFEMYNAFFVTKVLAKPKTTDWTVVLGAAIFALIVIALVAIFVFGLKV